MSLWLCRFFKLLWTSSFCVSTHHVLDFIFLIFQFISHVISRYHPLYPLLSRIANRNWTFFAIPLYMFSPCFLFKTCTEDWRGMCSSLWESYSVVRCHVYEQQLPSIFTYLHSIMAAVLRWKYRENPIRMTYLTAQNTQRRDRTANRGITASRGRRAPR